LVGEKRVECAGGEKKKETKEMGASLASSGLDALQSAMDRLADVVIIEQPVICTIKLTDEWVE